MWVKLQQQLGIRMNLKLRQQVEKERTKLVQLGLLPPVPSWLETQQQPAGNDSSAQALRHVKWAQTYFVVASRTCCNASPWFVLALSSADSLQPTATPMINCSQFGLYECDLW